MKKTFVSFVSAIMFLSVIGAAFAGGNQNCNKNRGDEGQGEVNQVNDNNQDNQSPADDQDDQTSDDNQE